jgi:hypothetical protein
MARYAAGDGEAFEALFARWERRAYGCAASVGILGLGLAGICGAACPDQHFLHWWSRTGFGASVEGAGGQAVSALCFGLVTTLFVGAVAAFVLLGPRQAPPVRPLLPAAMLLVLLAPGVALQSVGVASGVLSAWLAGSAAGAWLGVAGGGRVRSLLGARRTD